MPLTKRLYRVADLDGPTLDAVVASIVGSTPSWGFRPSSEWRSAGGLIERERIALYPNETGGWTAFPEAEPACVGYGATPLLAAMRAFITFKNGPEIEL